jgi:hypothetical protein
MKYHTNTLGPDNAGFARGFKKAIEEALSNETGEVLLKTHTLGNLEGVISSVLGDKFFKKFKKNRVLKFEGVSIFLETERINSPFTKGVIFAPFVSADLFSKCLSDYRATDTVYIPWEESESLDYVVKNSDSIQL